MPLLSCARVCAAVSANDIHVAGQTRVPVSARARQPDPQHAFPIEPGAQP